MTTRGRPLTAQICKRQLCIRAWPTFIFCCFRKKRFDRARRCHIVRLRAVLTDKRDISEFVGLMSAQEQGRKLDSTGGAFTTNPTLFLRINATDPGPREIAWEEFKDRYAPMIAGF